MLKINLNYLFLFLPPKDNKDRIIKSLVELSSFSRPFFGCITSLIYPFVDSAKTFEPQLKNCLSTTLVTICFCCCLLLLLLLFFCCCYCCCCCCCCSYCCCYCCRCCCCCFSLTFTFRDMS